MLEMEANDLYEWFLTELHYLPQLRQWYFCLNKLNEVPHSKQFLVPPWGFKGGMANTPPGPKCSWLLLCDSVDKVVCRRDV